MITLFKVSDIHVENSNQNQWLNWMVI